MNERQAIKAKHIVRAFGAFQYWGMRPQSPLREYAFLDALSFCFDTALSDAIVEEMKLIRHEELRMDAEGRPLNDEGDTIFDADLVYIPLEKLS